MANDKPKTDPPPYTSYGTFSNFIKGLKEAGVPHQIDKAVLSKLSGSSQAALLGSLRWLGLIDQAGVPTPKLEELVAADGPKYSEILGAVLKERYTFISDGSVNLTKATGTQIEGKFREYGIAGSTIVKSIAFFISACKESKITLGPYVKTPKIASGPKRPRKAAESVDALDDDSEGDDGDDHGEREGFVRIAIPLHGMNDGVVYLPEGLSPTEWQYALKITKFLLDNYRPDAEAKP